MYCSSCGKAVSRGLSFCNQCGTRVGGAQEPDAGRLSEASHNFLLAGILGIPIAGVGVLIGLMSVMKKELGFSNELVVAFASLGFLLLLAAEGVFIWTLIHRTRAARETGQEESASNVLGEARVRELPEPTSFVTESTTRTLEPVLRESKRR